MEQVLNQILQELQSHKQDVKELKQDVKELQPLKQDVKELKQDVKEFQPLKQDVKELKQDVKELSHNQALLDQNQKHMALQVNSIYLAIVRLEDGNPQDIYALLENIHSKAIDKDSEFEKFNRQ